MNWLNQLKTLLCGKKDNTASKLKLSDLTRKNLLLADSIENLKKSLVQANFSLEEDSSKILGLNVKIQGLQDDIKVFEELDKHSSLSKYLSWLKNNIKRRKVIVDTSLGSVFPHTYLKVTDKTLVRDFAQDIIPINSMFKSEDDLVYAFCAGFYKKYPTKKFYESDFEVFKKREVFSTPEETISLLANKGTYADCDNARGLMYACLTVLLDDYFPGWNRLRLLAFDVDIFLGKLGGHAILAWVKEGVNDFIPIESTYYQSNFREMWIKEYRLRDNTIAYRIRYSFDDTTEYKLPNQ